MARNRMTFEKQQRDAKKKRKAEEKRAQRQKKKEQAQNTLPEIDLTNDSLPTDESIDSPE